MIQGPPNRGGAWWRVPAAGVALLLAAAVVRLFAQDPHNRSAPNPSTAAEPVPAEAVAAAVTAATDYLVAHCDEDGRFTYLADAEHPAGIPDAGYNLLRHCGALYALAKIYEDDPRPDVREAMIRAAGFLRRESLDMVAGNPHFLAVWSTAELTGGDHARLAKLGGAGLALVSLLEVERHLPDVTPDEDFRRLGRFILFMQKHDGSFYSRYVEGEGRDDSWKSMYYPGEAALGLLMLYEFEGSPRWLQSAAEALAALVRQDRSNRVTLPDQWRLLATERLMLHYDQCRKPLPDERILQNAARTSRDMIADQARVPSGVGLDGCFSEDGRVCPSATRLEGLLAARNYVPPSMLTSEEIDASIHRGMRFLVSSQLTGGPLRGGFPRAVGPSPSVAQDAAPGEVRVDFVQHAVCALIQYRRAFGLTEAVEDRDS